MTTEDIARQKQVSKKTVERHIEKGHTFPEWLQLVNNGRPFPYGKNDTIPPKAAEYLLSEKRAPEPPFAAKIEFSKLEPEAIVQVEPKTPVPGLNGSHKNPLSTPDNGQTFEDNPGQNLSFVPDNRHTPEDKIGQESTFVLDFQDKKDKPFVPELSQDRHEDKTGDSLSDKLFHRDIPSVLAMTSLVLADSFSCAWIAYHAFSGNWAAVGFFALVGTAVAYASIRNAIQVTGWDADKWLWGFGVFQFMLHMAAFGMFDWIAPGASSAIGITAICISIPMGTTGIAITFRPKK